MNSASHTAFVQVQRRFGDEASPFITYLESSGTEQVDACRFRRILKEDATGVVEWAAAGGASLGLEAPLWERARRLRGLLPEARSERPVFAVLRMSSECLVVVALPGGFVAGQIDFDLGVEAAAERLWDASRLTDAA